MASGNQDHIDRECNLYEAYGNFIHLKGIISLRQSLQNNRIRHHSKL